MQTEDKGLQKRMIMSLVYDKGTILASKRESYDDLVAGDFDSKELATRVGRQHKLICAAVKAGRIDELKQMSAKSVGGGSKTLADVANAGIAAPGPTPTRTAAPPTAAVPPKVRLETTVPPAAIHIAIVENQRVAGAPAPPAVHNEPVIEPVRIIEDPHILPANAVAVISELSGRERPTNSKLSLELLGDTKFKGGDRRTVNIMICRGTGRKVVGDAQIMIKVLGSSFRPIIFHAKSDANGLARVHLQLPHFKAGRAAMLVRAMAGGEEIEVRRVVTPG